MGKSTLLERAAGILPGHATMDEPYYLLESEGYEGADPPSIEDFEAQLERSLVVMEEREPNVLFDRSPVDILAYLLSHEDAALFEADDWLGRIHEAVRTLGLVVFVPVEDRDRIPLPAHEDREYRLAVHEKLQSLLEDDALGFETEVLTVRGDIPRRLGQILDRIGER